MKPKAQYGNTTALPIPYSAALHTGYTAMAHETPACVARMKPKAQYGNTTALPIPYSAALHTGYTAKSL